MKNRHYPIIIGRNFKKGIFVFKSKLFKGGGLDVGIVRLKKDFETGDKFDIDDVETMEVDLHFCDKVDLQTTINALANALAGWEEDDESNLD